MISIVIVSHSARLAEGVVELAGQMVQNRVKIAAAGGIDDPENPIGTDPMRVLAAIEEVYSEDGVLVLMDLGSALMSAEMALEFLPPERAKRVFLCEAPLVEGALAAAVQAMTGATIEAARQEARAALDPKKAQLAPLLGLEEETAAPAAASEPDSGAPQESLRLTVPNRLGLHARPAAKLVNLAGRFRATIEIRKNGRLASAKSVNQVATLGARQGDELVFIASGPDAADALQAIQHLAAENFGDQDDAPVEIKAERASGTAAHPDGLILGSPASPGIAVGPATIYTQRLPQVEVKEIDPDGIDAELDRLNQALQAAEEELRLLQTRTTRRLGAEEAAIFEAHALILEDPSLHHDVRQQLANRHVNVEAAWLAVIEETADLYRALDDPYMAGRAQDVVDVGQRVLRHLMDIKPQAISFPKPIILVADELSPSDTAQLDITNVLGILTARGGATGHSAILARALGIPAVVGAIDSVPLIEDGQEIALDGTTGQVWLSPDADTKGTLLTQRADWLAQRAAAQAAAQAPAVTADGVPIEIAANIGSPHDALQAVRFGAEGVGLFRTEFLFMDRTEPPSEEEQFQAYSAAAENLDGRPLIIRTLDVGGDKPLAYLDIGYEDNPFLGWRALRYCLDHPEIFLPQLRAILRASASHPIRLMFPMVSSLDELHRGKALLGEARASLDRSGLPYNDDIELGIMIEVPAAVMMADLFASEVDFFSIGTNDLTQYIMAADRGNARVSGLLNPLHPAVIRSIQATAAAARACGIWTGICGELAGSPLATPLLIGLGITELSMSAPSIPAVKEIVGRLTVERAEQIARKVLTMASPAEIEQYLAAVGEM